MTGMLSAIPKTPLHDRLAAEGRLDPADTSEFGTNVIPLQISREELRDGYVQVMTELYEPEAYFERLEDLYLEDGIDIGRGRSRYWKTPPAGAAQDRVGLAGAGDRPVPAADERGPRGPPPRASTASGSGGSSRSARTRARCSSTSSTWPCTTTPTRWPSRCPRAARGSTTRTERDARPEWLSGAIWSMSPDGS